MREQVEENTPVENQFGDSNRGTERESTDAEEHLQSVHRHREFPSPQTVNNDELESGHEQSEPAEYCSEKAAVEKPVS